MADGYSAAALINSMNKEARNKEKDAAPVSMEEDDASLDDDIARKDSVEKTIDNVEMV